LYKSSAKANVNFSYFAVGTMIKGIMIKGVNDAMWQGGDNPIIKRGLYHSSIFIFKHFYIQAF